MRTQHFTEKERNLPHMQYTRSSNTCFPMLNNRDPAITRLHSNWFGREVCTQFFQCIYVMTTVLGVILIESAVFVISLHT